MIRMLIHHTGFKDRADAVFWIVDGELRSHIPEESEGTRLAMVTLYSKANGATWEAMFDFLASHSNDRDVWIPMQATDPVKAFEALR